MEKPPVRGVYLAYLISESGVGLNHWSRSTGKPIAPLILCNSERLK